MRSLLAREITLLWKNLGFVVAFMLVVCLPWISWLLRIEDHASSEKRLLSAPPSINTAQDVFTFPSAFDRYFDDKFPQRNRMVHAYFLFMYRLFGDSGSQKVLAGREDWLFYSSEHVIDDYQNITPLTIEQLAYMQQSLDDIHAFLDVQGIAFVVVVPPNKTSIYPEYLPRGVRRFRDTAKLDQIVDYFATHAETEILDLRAPLLSAKQEYLIYQHTDTHWTGYGAYIAYQEIARQLQETFPDLQMYEWEDVRFVVESGMGGDLASMLTLQNDLPETNICATLPEPLHSAELNNAESSSDVLVFEVDNVELPQAVIFYDSFFPSMRPLVSEHFSRSVYVLWPTRYNLIARDTEKMVAQESPDVVVLEIVERWIYQLLEPEFMID